MEQSSLADRFDVPTLRGSEIPIVIFGAETVGEAIYHECMDLGISVSCFCDNYSEFTSEAPLLSSRRTNWASPKKFDLSVTHPDDLKAKYDDAIFLISVCDIQDIVAQLDRLGYKNWYPGGLLLKSFDANRHEFSAPVEFVEYAVDAAITCHEGYLNPEKIYLRSLDIIITEKCSLKCADCSNLAQYFVNPRDDDLDELIDSIHTFFQTIDEVNEVRVIGGEPFMNKNIYPVLGKLTEIDHISKILVFTNGTILPRKEHLRLLAQDKIMMIITDYDELAKNHSALVDLCDENNIAYYSEVANGWTDCATVRKHNRTVAEQESVFNRCCAKNLITLSKGKIYRCPFAANIDRLGASPDYEEDYININNKPTKLDYKKYFREKSFLEVCDFCNGRFLSDPVIEPAIQLKSPIPYKRYR